MKPRLCLSCALSSAACLLLAVSTTLAQVPDAEPSAVWGPNGPVKAITRVGTTLFVGGEFTTVGPATGGLAIADAGDASSVTTTSDVGTVNAIAPDGAGGWYAAQWKDLSPSPTVLRISANGARHPLWVPPSFDYDILGGLAVHAGRLFVAGQFGSVNGVTRRYLVALDATSGAVLPWTTTLRSGLALNTSTRVAVGDGRVYISAVDFVAGQSHPDVIAVDAMSGALLPFQIPPLPGGNQYERLAVAGTRLIATGVGCGSTIREGVCAFADNGQALWSWAPEIDGQRFWAIWTTADRVYVGLRDPEIVLAFDAATGTALPWSIPGPTLVGSLADDGTTVYAATLQAGSSQAGLVAFDRGSAAPLHWQPVVGSAPLAVAAAGGRVAFGGQFRTAGGIRRRNLVAIDLATGRATERAPEASGPVHALAALGDFVVVAKGSAAPEVFAFSATTGERLAWGLVPNGQPLALAVAGGALYIGGYFSELSGQTRGSLAAVDLGSGGLLPWDPRLTFEVSELTASDTSLYAAGTVHGGVAKTARAVAFSLSTRDRLPFDPPLNWISGVRYLAASSGRVLSTGRYWGPPRAFGISWLHAEFGHVQGDLGLPFPTSIAVGGRDRFFVGGRTDFGGGRLGAFDALYRSAPAVGARDVVRRVLHARRPA